MDTNVLSLIRTALEGSRVENFSAEDVNLAAVNAIKAQLGFDKDTSPREFRYAEDRIFALIEQSVDEILPKKIESLLGEFAEVKQFDRDAEPLFNIEKIGKNRAKLTISKGARSGIYRAARLDNKHFTVDTTIVTAAVFVTAEEIMLGKISLKELFDNIIEGFTEHVYLEVFNALAAGKSVSGHDRIPTESTTKNKLGAAIDAVMPIVRQYGIPTIFGSYQAVCDLANPTVNGGHNDYDANEMRAMGHIGLYKGAKIVELPNYLIDNTNKKWFYDPSYVFVIPSSIKPVKVALRGETVIRKHADPTGSEKWNADKLMGVGLAMANNYAVIKLSDVK